MFLNEDYDIDLLESYDDSNITIFDEKLDQIVNEAILLDMCGDALNESDIYDLVEEGLLSEKSIVKIDKYGKRNLAIKKAALALAEDNNDPLYKKLSKVYKQKKQLVDAIMKKYGVRAESVVRKKKANPKIKSTASKVMKRIGKEVRNQSSQYAGHDMPSKK